MLAPRAPLAFSAIRAPLSFAFPTTTSTTVDTPTAYIYGQVFSAGLTDANSSPAPGVLGGLGYGPDGANPTASNFVWTAAATNPSYNFAQNNDEGGIKAGAMPFDYCGRLDQLQHLVPLRPDALQRDPKYAVGVVERRSLRAALQDCELMAQGEVFEREIAAGTKCGDGTAKDRSE